jgi:hypothetical protein
MDRVDQLRTAPDYESPCFGDTTAPNRLPPRGTTAPNRLPPRGTTAPNQLPTANPKLVCILPWKFSRIHNPLLAPRGTTPVGATYHRHETAVKARVRVCRGRLGDASCTRRGSPRPWRGLLTLCDWLAVGEVRTPFRSSAHTTVHSSPARGVSATVPQARDGRQGVTCPPTLRSSSPIPAMVGSASAGSGCVRLTAAVARRAA